MIWAPSQHLSSVWRWIDLHRGSCRWCIARAVETERTALSLYVF
jgi:hypothetical protein